MNLWGRVALVSVCVAGAAAEVALDPMPVCDAMTHSAAYQGKPVALVGRYSFRKNGRWLEQEGCGARDERAEVVLVLDSADAPKPPEPVAIDETALEQKLTAIKQRTALARFKFGSADYDRWAVVFGRLETAQPDRLQLVYRGDGAVFFFVDK